MSELSKRMRELRTKASDGDWTFFHGDDDSFMNTYGVQCDAPAHKLHHLDEPDIGDVDPNTMICLTLFQSKRVVSHRDYRWAENAEFIAEAANEIGNLCDEIERLEAENADLRAKLAELYDPLSALDAACRASGLSLADDYEQRLAEWRAYVDSPVDPADLDSALYRPIADDPKAHPDGDRGP